MTAKDFALQAIAPYYADPKTCGYNPSIGSCVYLTEDGRKCVFGKYMLPEILESYKDSTDSAYSILNDHNDQSKVLIPEVVNILTTEQWRNLQKIHDCISYQSSAPLPLIVKELNLFTLDELKEFASNLQTNKN